MHRFRQTVHGDVGPSGPYRSGIRGTLCGYCDKPARVMPWKGRDHLAMCLDHYVELYPSKGLSVSKGRQQHGYVRVQNEAEHRMVLEWKIGRPLERHESPHHKNGIRHDNRPENLELWVTPPRYGQRPEDLAEWVVQHYPELVERAQREFQLKLAI